MQPLRFTTWLAPGLPTALFETIAERVSAGLGRPYELAVESRVSGPLDPADDRFADGSTDIGFICPPSFLWLSGRVPPSVVALPIAPVFDDPRCEGRPVYYADVIVRSDSSIAELDDLAGARVGFNDRSSLSGYVSILARLADDGRDQSFLGEFVQVGSHRRALDLIATGEIDAAAIDTNVWHRWLVDQDDSEEALGAATRPAVPRSALVRSIASLGPFPVQPIVVRAAVADELAGPLAEQLVHPPTLDALSPFGVTGFAPITADAYEPVRQLVAAVA